MEPRAGIVRLIRRVCVLREQGDVVGAGGAVLETADVGRGLADPAVETLDEVDPAEVAGSDARHLGVET
mgnify:CR=1 FL=1